MNLKRYLHGSPDYHKALVLRQAELRTPLGLTYSAQDLAAEVTEILFGAFLPDESVVGSLSLRDDAPGVKKMRQVVVHPQWRGRCVGRRLVAAAEEYCRSHGIHRIELHARTAVLPFYLSLGYEVTGEEFTEVTLPHLAMYKNL